MEIIYLITNFSKTIQGFYNAKKECHLHCSTLCICRSMNFQV